MKYSCVAIQTKNTQSQTQTQEKHKHTKCIYKQASSNWALDCCSSKTKHKCVPYQMTFLPQDL